MKWENIVAWPHPEEFSRSWIIIREELKAQINQDQLLTKKVALKVAARSLVSLWRSRSLVFTILNMILWCYVQ